MGETIDEEARRLAEAEWLKPSERYVHLLAKAIRAGMRRAAEICDEVAKGVRENAASLREPPRQRAEARALEKTGLPAGMCLWTTSEVIAFAEAEVRAEREALKVFAEEWNEAYPKGDPRADAVAFLVDEFCAHRNPDPLKPEPEKNR